MRQPSEFSAAFRGTLWKAESSSDRGVSSCTCMSTGQQRQQGVSCWCNKLADCTGVCGRCLAVGACAFAWVLGLQVLQVSCRWTARTHACSLLVRHKLTLHLADSVHLAAGLALPRGLRGRLPGRDALTAGMVSLRSCTGLLGRAFCASGSS